ncbi:hypothetical protein HRbin15_02727 [bacterium HR15]|nr:hypothetical protein HRbin15_02727 [bacterium HR15]
MWVHVGLAVQLGSPMSVYAPLRDYIREGPDAGLADPNWRVEQIDAENEFLRESASRRAQIVSVAAKGQTLPYEYTHQKNAPRRIAYPRVDPLWGTIKLLPLLQQAGISIEMAQVMVMEHAGGWSNQSPIGIGKVPDGTYLWPLNQSARSSNTLLYWWNYWTDNPYPLNQQGLGVLRATAKLGWMESWDFAAITVVGAQSVDERNRPELNNVFTWTVYSDECSGRQVILLMGGIPRRSSDEGIPAFLMYKDVQVLHPWATEQDRWRSQVADAHRAQIQVGAVQTVEKFNEGSFGYTSGRRLRYFLSETPPLLDTYSCPRDSLAHAWYANRGNPMVISIKQDGRRIRYQSYRLLSEIQPPEDPWLARIGWLDSPAFVVPPLDGSYSIAREQTSTPTLMFYTAIAVRTQFFPFSYVPVIATGGWKINFNGTASYDPLSGQLGYSPANGGGVHTHTPTLGQPETLYGPYNSKINGRWER